MCVVLFVVVWKFQILQAGCGFRLHNHTASIFSKMDWTQFVWPGSCISKSYFELSWLKRRHCEIKVDTV